MSATDPVIELYSIGTELVYGRIQDSNSFWMSQQIVNLGVKVRRITQLTDDIEDIQAAFRASVTRGTDIVITSGGLGPTPDDLTTTALAAVAGVELVVNEDVVQDFMQRRNIEQREDMNPNALRMATVPSNARVMMNPVGWAPVIATPVGDSTFLSLPGPPREMEATFVRHVIPYISEHYEVKAATQRVYINTHESAVAPYFQEIMKQYPGSYLKGYIALTETPGWLPVDILATGSDTEEAQLNLQSIIDGLTKMVAEQGKQVTAYPAAATSPQ
ncbi:MAG: competence/damage-inducible protein A [Candidatus Poribacteria bacterium]|nr:competence/damage-inducible protein A [Candidatus Poribacteria bacterium]